MVASRSVAVTDSPPTRATTAPSPAGAPLAIVGGGAGASCAGSPDRWQAATRHAAISATSLRMVWIVRPGTEGELVLPGDAGMEAIAVVDVAGLERRRADRRSQLVDVV